MCRWSRALYACVHEPTHTHNALTHLSQVKEDDGRWAGVEIYRSKRNPADVVLFFGGEEYEGLAGGYRYSKTSDNRMVLTDADGMVIETRTAGFKSKKRKKTTQDNKKQARMRPSSKYLGVYKNVDKGTWAAKVCHGRGRTSVIKCLTEKAAASAYDRHLGRAVNLKSISIKPRVPASSLRGVSWDADSMRWRAAIEDGGRTRVIGLFRSEREAAEAYDSEARQLTTITEFNFEPEATSGADIGTKSASYEVVSDPALARALAVAVSQFRRHQQLRTHRDPLQGKFLNRLSRKYHVDSLVLLDRLNKFIA